jgi:hypothetical protein
MKIKRFNWTRTPTAWQQLQSWQARRSQMRAEFETKNAAAQSAFTNALSNQISGSASLAGQTAIDRIKAATKAVVDKTA